MEGMKACLRRFTHQNASVEVREQLSIPNKAKKTELTVARKGEAQSGAREVWSHNSEMGDLFGSGEIDQSPRRIALKTLM
jgi:hypothetical protein